MCIREKWRYILGKKWQKLWSRLLVTYYSLEAAAKSLWKEEDIGSVNGLEAPGVSWNSELVYEPLESETSLNPSLKFLDLWSFASLLTSLSFNFVISKLGTVCQSLSYRMAVIAKYNNVWTSTWHLVHANNPQMAVAIMMSSTVCKMGLGARGEADVKNYWRISEKENIKKFLSTGSFISQCYFKQINVHASGQILQMLRLFTWKFWPWNMRSKWTWAILFHPLSALYKKKYLHNFKSQWSKMNVIPRGYLARDWLNLDQNLGFWNVRSVHVMASQHVHCRHFFKCQRMEILRETALR